MKSSTHSSTPSALCVNHSHHFSGAFVSAGAALLVVLGGVGCTGASSSSDGIVSSRPDADATILDIESMLAGIVASCGVAKGEGARECVGGSAGVSSGVVESLWCPEGVRGRRRVPLLGAGVRERVSQIML
jgi:hypothetical protein